ncbi:MULTISPECIES: sodium:calcium antiporter [unclassified Haladaptatus]|uniref:sodium:calcium antiporter n=1 Tax=unclassified Haladaptatus TaxID=2622732 RepID=UPI00209C57CE|nr:MULTISPECIES: sodium:calcium antiporter [unclassified Haladaptatus]MCO8246184.1 sodium:calcium antiporter [Haladaptatus sp. AB643]MCO8254195.1 sodium:calcium antiporter [Haladaptatus sp. AB618]
MSLPVTGYMPPLALSESWTKGLLLLASFGLLLLGAEVFTNGVEWLGYRLGISESATGSILAAMGTALPETTIPVIAILKGGEGASDVGVGAILGAPFMLATIAMFLVGASVYYFADRRSNDTDLQFNQGSTKRDLTFFLIGYSLAFIAALIPKSTEIATIPIRDFIAIFLVLLYLGYLYLSLRAGELADDDDMDDLHVGLAVEGILERFGSGPDKDHSSDPHFVLTALQTLIALTFIVIGARLFVDQVEWVSSSIGIPYAIVALIIAPIATELPEAFNSVLWLARDKDTLALNNITGAMAFQGTLPVTLGILFTPWNLNLTWGTPGFLNAISVLFAIAAGCIVLFRARRVGEGDFNPTPFLGSGAFYVVFLALAVYFVMLGA